MTTQQTSYLGSEEQPAYVPSSDERTMAILSHVLCLVVWLFAPLIIYLIKKDESTFVAFHAKESLNFQLTVFVLALICIPLVLILIGVLLLWLLGIISTILVIVATIRASENKLYRYPINFRFIK
ncbi:MAG TPA: DUF4870 domain-containing protein [Chitinophagaceae bacterium]